MREQRELFEVAKTVQQATRYPHRIVVIDHHIIAQFHDSVNWWTMSKANNNDEGDFAVWEETDANMRRAVKLAGSDAPIVRADRYPLNDRERWYAGLMDKSPKPNTPEGYRMALRELARDIELQGD